MSGPGEGKKLLGKVNVYIHEKGKSNARITHIESFEKPQIQNSLRRTLMRFPSEI